MRLAAIAIAAGVAATASVPAARADCSAPAYRQFDFFRGDWDAYAADAPTKIVARNHVTPMLDGCALREVYDKGAYHGESFSTYDAARRTWHQSWVDNAGELLLLDGHLDGTRMTFNAVTATADGTESRVRAVWYPVPGGVRETAERSRDGGKTWSPWFDLVFRPHRP